MPRRLVPLSCLAWASLARAEEPPIPDVPAVQAAVATYTRAPLATEGAAAAALVLDYAQRSSDVHLTLSADVTPWMMTESREISTALLGAWFVGAVGWQVNTPEATAGEAAQYCAGFEEVIRTYGLLQQGAPELRVASVDRLGELKQRGALDAHCAEVRGRLAEGSDSVDGLDQSRPSAADIAVLQQAETLEAQGQAGRAVKLIEPLHDRNPDNLLILHELALAYRQAGKPAKAVAVLKPHALQLPANTLASYASALDDSGNSTLAIAVLRAGIQRFPTSGLLYSELGTALRSAGSLEEAVTAFTDGMRVEVTWPSNYRQAARLMAATNEPVMALVWGETVCHLEPGPRCQEMAAVIAHVFETAVTQEKDQEGKITTSVQLAAGGMAVELAEDGTATTDRAHAIELALMVPMAPHLTEPSSLARLHAMRDMFLAPEHHFAEGLHIELYDWLSALRAAGHLEAYDYVTFGGAFLEEAKQWVSAHEAEVKATMTYVKAHRFLPTKVVAGTDRVPFDLAKNP